MIARGASVGAVCFRCQIRLLRQLAPVRYVSNDAATATNRAGDRVDGDGEDGGRDGGLDRRRDTSQYREFKSRRLSRSERRINLPKRYVSRDRILEETAPMLGLNMLGKPAHAIVMRDGGKITRRGIPLMDETPSNLDGSIEALLDRQQALPTLDEVRSNIQDLQPQADRVLSEKDFSKLRNLLAKGFLSTQLQDYLERHKSDASQPELPWVLEMRPWVSLHSQPDAAEGADLKLQGYLSDTGTPKERLATRLMRECWGLSIAEQETQLGETWIKLRDHEFVLLMRGTQRFMKNLGDVYLEPGERIEAFGDQQALRLVTTRLKAASLVELLDERLKQVTTKTFPVLLIGSKVPDPAVLEQVGLITNTYVRKSHNSNRGKLHVDWIEIKSRAARGFSVLEDLAHIVFRLLLTASGLQQATSSLVSPMPSQAYPGRLIVDVTSKDKLGWKDRMAQWARYVYPVTPEKSVVDAVLPIKKFELPFEPSARPEKLNNDFEFFRPTEFPFHPVKWSNVGQTSTTAHFGHILHSYQPSNSTPLLSDLLTSTERHVFSPSTPHPLHLIKFESNDPASSPLVTTKSTIVLRFWPSPSTNPTSKQDSSEPQKGKKKTLRKPSKHAGDALPAPILELRLAASDREILGIESLRAVKRTHHTDVMLPASLVDVRFTQTQYETLLAADRETLAAWQPLADFLKSARLDLEKGKLEMPPRQRFPLPRRLLNTDPSSSLTTASSSPPSPSPLTAATTESTDSASQHRLEQQSEETDDDVVSVSYEFVGLELHRSATVPFEGHQLTYTSIEAGQGGGRRAEVILEPLEPITSPTEAVDRDRLQEDFLACCSRFAADRSLWSGVGNRDGRI
ncbi:hypothetical protein F5Y09DRAFT_303765 [Xylaria sp. FL1042]|nr:hypothetical protein F5Y09DRAFT_303765 [Xylaria sp. FL1042]